MLWCRWPTQVEASELYDYESDPDGTANVVAEPGYGMVAKDLREKLREGWRGEITQD